MFRLLSLLLLLTLLTVACSRNPAWPPASAGAPQLGGALPKFLIQQEVPGAWPPSNELVTLDPQTGEAIIQSVSGAPDLAALLSAEYRVVEDTLVGEQGEFYVVPGNHVAPNGLWAVWEREDSLSLRRVDDAGMLTLSNNGRSFHPIWSPDSQWLAYQDNDGLWALAIPTLAIQSLSSTSLEPLAWLDNNSQLLLREGQTVSVLDLATQNLRPLPGVDGNQIHGRPAGSPDDKLVYARYGENGRLDLNTAGSQPDDILARLVAIHTDGRQEPIQALLPEGQDQGISQFYLSPEGSAIMARHFHCASQPSGLIPLLRTRQCTGRLLVVEPDTGNYTTLTEGDYTGIMAWGQGWPAVTLSELPMPPEPVVAPPAAPH